MISWTDAKVRTLTNFRTKTKMCHHYVDFVCVLFFFSHVLKVDVPVKETKDYQIMVDVL